MKAINHHSNTNLSALLNEHNITVSDLAGITRLQKNSLSKICSGDPPNNYYREIIYQVLTEHYEIDRTMEDIFGSGSE